MVQCDDPPVVVARRRGRPVNSDSAETRNRILRASRQVINERGYQAATFQAIAVAADLSRPTLHYYFATREEIYLTLVAEARDAVATFVDRARRRATLVEQFTALLEAFQDTDLLDRSQVAFLVSAGLESVRIPELRALGGLALQDVLTTLVTEARDRGELAEDVDVGPVAEMLGAMLWGVSFYAGFVGDAADLTPITAQLHALLAHGLPTHAATPTPLRDTEGDTPSVVGGRQ
ncbi:TetR family transcriptional regulator [Mycolicibacterium madagascariense]|uniref:TetR family transcriptional regulator n=1 Tax=Mycolicibacterium madagascariense TaxID=212765 RepID=A0A7I7XGQ9_9MYCO|nr:TetR/AcrR family transcriptional regulator [Mycolicibacterium madagascariense]MCV7013324.1 TetR/AcrR family transcriptional regulator [Mycolicibacterium madagascariense]BBZ28376.1 TetR family transcriptional regulator [Mycolicibacterium madagascariense]